MKTMIKAEETKEFKKISHKHTESCGDFFKVVDMNKHLKETCEPPYVNSSDVLMTLDDNYLHDYEKGELVLNLTQSRITFIPFDAKIIELEPADFMACTVVFREV